MTPEIKPGSIWARDGLIWVEKYRGELVIVTESNEFYTRYRYANHDDHNHEDPSQETWDFRNCFKHVEDP